jgi:hypothetical protein
MTVHLLKLCVGVETVQELKAWQTERLANLRKARKVLELRHRTLQTPRRRDDLLSGGSLYWVIKGFILARQRVLDLKLDVKDDGSKCCAIVLDPELIGTFPQRRRAFQGWRYLEPVDAPKDRGEIAGGEDLPPGMREELRELRLIDW